MLWIAGAALTSFLGNLCAVNAINLAPNPGYASAIEASKAALVVLLSVLLFASDFSFLKGLGVMCCTIGVVMLVWPSETIPAKIEHQSAAAVSCDQNDLPESLKLHRTAASKEAKLEPTPRPQPVLEEPK